MIKGDVVTMYDNIEEIVCRAYAYDKVRSVVEKYEDENRGFFEKLFGKHHQRYDVSPTLFIQRALIDNADDGLIEYLEKHNIPIDDYGIKDGYIIVELDKVKGEKAIYSDTKILTDIADIIGDYREGLTDFSPDIPYQRLFVTYDNRDEFEKAKNAVETAGYKPRIIKMTSNTDERTLEFDLKSKD